MGNQLLTPPEVEPEKMRPAEEEPKLLLETDSSMWSSLISNLRDTFTPLKQPPLQLSSQPVAIKDLEVEESVWKSLVTGIRDRFSAKKLPPLDLTSKPVAVTDPMAVKRDPLSSALAITAHVLVIGLILLFFYSQWRTRAIQRKMNTAQVDVK